MTVLRGLYSSTAAWAVDANDCERLAGGGRKSHCGRLLAMRSRCPESMRRPMSSDAKAVRDMDSTGRESLRRDLTES